MATVLRLLLIDDDEIDRMAVLRALLNSQVVCDVKQANTAASGLAMVAQQEFDAILLDYRLPDMDGADVLRTIRSRENGHAAVIMISRHEDESLAELCLELGAQDFLLKDEVSGRRLSRCILQARHRYRIEEALKHSHNQFRLLSEHDPLTGLFNRRYFERALQVAITSTKRSKAGLAILLLDLDDFKSINDTLGHDAGDVLLIEIGRRLSSVVRDGDCLCRLGGDEFVILMTSLEENEQAILLADRILDVLKYPIELGGAQHIVTTSIGIAVLETPMDTVTDLMKCADLAMYQAKQCGRNQARFYSSSLQIAVQTKADIKRDLKSGIANNEFKIYYQVLINAKDGSISGLEALLRWQHPTLGLLLPEDFIPVAEETGMIIEIGNWTLREGCGQLKEWQSRYPLKCAKFAIAINVSPVQLKYNLLFDVIKNALAEFELPPESLELEITESALITPTSEIVALLNSLVVQGVSLSLDDFGTGFSSLERILIYPFRTLKIDKGFIAAIGEGGKSEQLLIAIMAFAKTLGMRVIAEGVETKTQADFCILHDCDLLQGYWYSLPITAVDFEEQFLMKDSTL